MFKDKILLITGGTGSFGNAVLNKFINTDIKEIRIFSRDEKKQDDLRRYYNNNNQRVFTKLKTTKDLYKNSGNKDIYRNKLNENVNDVTEKNIMKLNFFSI